MAPKAWLAIAGWSLLVLEGEGFLGLVLAFSPGWANGWPFRLTIHPVWSTGMSVLLFLLLVTAGVGIGAVACAGCQRFGIGPRRARVLYMIWLACSAILAALASHWAFGVIHASTREMWPDGYNP